MMGLAKRHLIIVAAESTEFRLSGLSELERFAQVVHSGTVNGVCPWTTATFITPDYGNLRCDGQYAYRLPVKFPQRANMLINGNRIKSPLPTSSEVWNDFAKDVRSAIHETLRQHRIVEADILCVDWPTGWVVSSLAAIPSFRVCFTVDVDPPDEALSIWWQGIDNAKTIHVFTRSWWEHLCRRFPRLLNDLFHRK
jgi:hypothetical protein